MTTPAGSRITRRAALSGAAGLVVTAFAGPLTAQDRTRTIPQPERPGREAFMERAFEMRRLAVQRGDQPYGAGPASPGCSTARRSWMLARRACGSAPTGPVGAPQAPPIFSRRTRMPAASRSHVSGVTP